MWTDTGFLGIKKEIKAKTIWMPYKSSKYQKIDEMDRFFNSFVASKRIVVENAISDLKRYFILKNRYRSLNLDEISENTQICAGLSNFKNFYNHYRRNLY